MRSLKFRAWGKDIKKFLYAELKPNAQIEDGSWRYNGYDDWEQYTGLKDKNGEEIYEGDIVTIVKRAFPAEVCEKRGMFAMRCGDGHFYEDQEIYLPVPIGWMKPERIEVVGNIHENPELLEGVK